MDKQKVIGILVIVVIAVGALLLLKRPMRNSQMLTDQEMDKISVSQPDYMPGIMGHFARPKEEGSHPGIIMVHERWGLNDNIKDMANQLAVEGYMVLAVDLFGRVTQNEDEARAQVSALNETAAFDNLRAALVYLRGQGASKVAALGWCFGGGQAMNFSVSGLPLSATVIYYGNLVTDEQKLATIKWPVLGIFDDKDTSIPVDTVRQFETALTNLGIEKEIYVYEGAGHACANPSGMNYAAKETRDAWAKTLAFLNKNLK
jgi:carboxymethylenebutenolidase